MSALAATPGSPWLLRRWLGFSMPVGRRFYFASGVFLMALKYAGDVAIVFAATHHVWTPWQWIQPLYTQRFSGLGLPVDAQWPLGLWALPFLWIGVTMTFRRAVDAGHSAWWALLFFAPLVNLALMLALSVLPSTPAPAWRPEESRVRSDEMMRSALLGIFAMLLLGTPIVALITLGLNRYGAGLFFGLPFALGAITGFIFNRRHPRTLTATSAVVIAGFAILGGSLLLFALEGIVCIAMAMPLALSVGTLGGYVGREIALRTHGGAAPAALAAIALPISMTMLGGAPPAAREVRSAVVIAAPPEVVWRHVVGFEPMGPPRELLFRAGVAYPIRARIEGSGAGAVRRCEFSTGAFVEPITGWEEPRRLSFDVAESPPPLEEWSPYRRVFAPHLRSSFRARRGEFRLVPLANGGTRLEGSTWYTLDVHPTVYWTPWADAFVHRIHRRVLEHIARLAERETRALTPAPPTP